MNQSEPKDHRFNSQQGHMPGLWARSPLGVCEGKHTLMFISSFSFPSSLSKNKYVSLLKNSPWARFVPRYSLRDGLGPGLPETHAYGPPRVTDKLGLSRSAMVLLHL